jgi:hypothetical protein
MVESMVAMVLADQLLQVSWCTLSTASVGLYFRVTACQHASKQQCAVLILN